MTAIASGHPYNAAGFNKGRPTCELPRQTDAKYAVYDSDEMSVELNGSEIQAMESSFSPHSVIEVLQETYDEEEEAKEEEVEAGEEEEEDEEVEEGEVGGEENEEEEREEEEEEEEAQEKDEEDIQDVCEIDEEPDFSQLYLAVERSDAQTVKRILMSSVDVNVLDANKSTRSQLYATVKELLNMKASVDPINAFGQIHSASVESILNIYDKVDVSRQPSRQPFYVAAKNGRADVVDALLERGICDFVTFSHSETPLHVAVNERHTKVVEVILKHSCRISDKLIKDENKLQETHANSTQASDSMSIELMKSDGRRASAEIIWARKITPLEIMRESFNGHTALELAVKSTQPKMVKTMLNMERCEYSEKYLGNSFRCMINKIALSYSGHRVLSDITRRNIMDVMEVLCYDIQHRMKCNAIIGIAHVLLNSRKFNVNHQDEKLNTLLHDAMKQCGNCRYEYLKREPKWRLLVTETIDHVVKLLLRKGADFNMKNAFGATPLILASENGCCHIIEALFDWELKSGIKLEVDARDQYGETALIKAAERHFVSVTRLLLNHGVSVNLHDYYGFTALHAAVYEPNRNWFDLHFFCKELRKRKSCNYPDDAFFEIRPISWDESIVDSFRTPDSLEKNLEYDKKTTRYKEDMVKLLLAINEINVNAIDFRGNTPLDLAVKSSERITSETFEALTNCGAIRKLLDSKDEAPIHEARVDERGRNPLHRLIISQISNYAVEDMKAAKREQDHERFNIMVHGVLLKPENFRWSATETDDKGRTPLHYAVMSSDSNICNKRSRDLTRVLIEVGSSANAADMYGKTPLHYAEMNQLYDLLIKHGAKETIKDKNGHTPRDLKQLRESVIINIDNAKKLPIGKNVLCTSRDTCILLNTDHVTQLSNRKRVQTVRIYSQSPRPKESSEDAIWKIWIQNDFLRLNRRVSQLRPSIQRFIERLADGIKERDTRFESQPILVGSASEETKAIISADFDFNFKLIKFSQLCGVFPHPLGPKGFFKLRRERTNAEMRVSDDEFACFFNLDQYLVTNEVNSRFHVVLEDVLHDPIFWQHEHLFEWNLTDIDENKYRQEIHYMPAGLCKTVRLRMINLIEDGEGGFIFVKVSIDVVACVNLEYSVLGDQPTFEINPALNADVCTFVFDRPRFDLSKLRDARCNFSDTFARISFAPLESRMIRESPSVIKAAYMVCKLILYDYPKTTYQLKTCLLFCLEALKVRRECEGRDEDKITPKELAFWVERIMFCFTEFHRHDVYPCYFMPSFRQKMGYLELSTISDYEELIKVNKPSLRVGLPPYNSFRFSAAFDIYLDLCPDNTAIDIPIIQNENTYDINNESLIETQDPKWEQFDRNEFIAMLSSVIST